MVIPSENKDKLAYNQFFSYTYLHNNIDPNTLESTIHFSSNTERYAVSNGLKGTFTKDYKDYIRWESYAQRNQTSSYYIPAAASYKNTSIKDFMALNKPLEYAGKLSYKLTKELIIFSEEYIENDTIVINHIKTFDRYQVLDMHNNLRSLFGPSYDIKKLFEQ